MSAFLLLVVYTRKQIAGGDVSSEATYEELQDRSNHKTLCFSAGCSPVSGCICFVLTLLTLAGFAGSCQRVMPIWTNKYYVLRQYFSLGGVYHWPSAVNSKREVKWSPQTCESWEVEGLLMNLSGLAVMKIAALYHVWISYFISKLRASSKWKALCECPFL